MSNATAPSQLIGIPACLKWLFSPPRWPARLLVGSLWGCATLLILPIPFMAGYAQRVIRSSMADPQAPPPPWDHMGRLYLDGLRSLLVLLAHWCPVGLVVWALFQLLGTAGVALGEPSDGNPLPGLILVAAFAILWLPFAAFAMYVLTAVIRLAATDRLGAAFEPRAILLLMRHNLGNYLSMYVVLLITSVVSQLGPCLCCVGLFPMAYWSQISLWRALGLIAAYDRTGLGTRASA
jgi:hypothetical protein